MDDGTTHHMYNDKILYMDALVKCNGVIIREIGGSVVAKGVGIIQLSIIDDQHRYHNIIPHNILYVPEYHGTLICPQRWAQESDMKERSNKEMLFCNFGGESIFVWNERKHMKTIFNDPATNFPVLQCKVANEDIV